MDDKKICFIMCTNDELYEKECIRYIQRLTVPEGYSIDIISVKEATSMASGYNEAMKATDAKYKVYLHQDVFIVYQNFLYEILQLFDNKEIGMIGAVGCPEMPESCVMWSGERVGALYTSNIFDCGQSIIGEVDGLYQEVEAIDGLIMITQYDILWREDVFKDWDFYDVSQSHEFIKKGYKVIVPHQEHIWCIHDDGFLNLEKYNRNRLIYKNEYLKKECDPIDDKKIAFIMCTNSEIYMKECEYYIRQLHVPEGMEIEVIKIQDAKSMASGYNRAMKMTNAKYKVYLHQDVFILYKDIISAILEIFKNHEIGMMGVIGGRVVQSSGEFSRNWDSGCTILTDEYKTFIADLDNDDIQSYEEVYAIDGMFMITQQDIEWDEESFDGWHFYDASQSVNFRSAGYKIVIPKQEKPWTLHDAGYCSYANYHHYRKIFCEKYSQLGFQYIEDQDDDISETKGLSQSEKSELLEKMDHLSVEEIIHMLNDFNENNVMDRKIFYMTSVMEIITKEIQKYGSSKFKDGQTYLQMYYKYIDIKFFLTRICFDVDESAKDKILKMLQDNLTFEALETVVNNEVLYKKATINKIKGKQQDGEKKLEKIYELQIKILDILKQNLMNFMFKNNQGILTNEDIFSMESILVDLVGKYRSLNNDVPGVPISDEVISNRLSKIKYYYEKQQPELVGEFAETLDIYFSSLKVAITYLNLYEKTCDKTKYILMKQFLKKYENSTDSEIQDIVQYVQEKQSLEAFNAKFIEKYFSMKFEVFYDEKEELYYSYKFGKKMYMAQKDQNVATNYIYFITMEQDEESPHRYFDDVVKVNEGDVVIDAGVAEGNFALEVIDKVKKIYLVECDPNWIKALKVTFKDYMDKVVIVDKMLGNYVDDTHTTIDEICKGEKVNFIKMDIEGAEMDALEGAQETLKVSTDCKLAVCSYHRHHAEREIKKSLDQLGFQTYTSKGYMWYCDDEDTLINLELRRGLVKAYK